MAIVACLLLAHTLNSIATGVNLVLTDQVCVLFDQGRVRLVNHAPLLAVIAHLNFIVKQLGMTMLVFGTSAAMLAT